MPGCCLEQVAPELGEWAIFFAAGAAKRAAAEAGLSHAVTEREADDLVRDVGSFLTVVEGCLGVPVPAPEPPRRLSPAARGRRYRVPGGARHRVGAVTDPFVHLHVASGYSMRFGANHPADLVARAAEHGMTALALTDRDGLYGAVKFALACRTTGVRPHLRGRSWRWPRPSTPPWRRPSPPASGARTGRPAGAGSPRGVAPASTRGCRGSPSSPGTAAAGGRCAG